MNRLNRKSFRLLNDNELHILDKLGGILDLSTPEQDIPEFIDWSKLEIRYERLVGGFTLCILKHSELDSQENQTIFLWQGVSRCSKHDKFNRIRGEAIAFKRAILESRPVSI